VNEPDVPEKPVERPSAAERAALAAPRAPVVRASGMRKPRIAREQAIVSDSGQLFIFSNPWANIKIDGKQISRTPMAAPLTLVAGKHRVELINDFCEPLAEEIDIPAKAIVRKRYTLQVLPSGSNQ